MRAWFGALVMGASLGCAVGCGGVEGLEPLEGEDGYGQIIQAGDTEDPYIERQGTSLTGYNALRDNAKGNLTALEKVPLSSFKMTGFTVKSVDLYQGMLRLTGTTLPVTEVASTGSCSGTPVTGVTRNCGWTSVGAGTCTPGTTVYVGKASCSSTCLGDPMIRVCTGQQTCNHGSIVGPAATTGMLGTDDDSSGCTIGSSSPCPLASFICPNSGVYNVLIAPEVHGSPMSFRPVASSGTFPVVETRTGAALTNAWFTGHLRNGETRTFMITEAWTSEQAGDIPDKYVGSTLGETHRYKVVEATHGYPALCSGDPAAAGDLSAIAVKGYWKDDGSHENDAAYLTFSCRMGVVAKCYRWGYRPWATTSSEDSMTGAQMHQSCTRMARADYCGTGVSNTADGTPINIFDTLTPPVKSAIHPTMTFEAAWGPDGATCASHARWAATPFDQFACAQLFHNDPDTQKPVRSQCDSAAEAQNPLFGLHTELFNNSYINVGP